MACKKISGVTNCVCHYKTVCEEILAILQLRVTILKAKLALSYSAGANDIDQSEICVYNFGVGGSHVCLP